MEMKSDASQDPKPTPGETAAERNNEPPSCGPIRKALTSESFVEKIAILLLTALLTGVLIPLMISYFNAQAAERQKELEARRARDAAIIQSQTKLLDEAANVIFTYETLALDVSWYKHPLGANEEMHSKAFARYNEQIVELTAKWRTLVSRSRTLASPAVSYKLEGFLEKIFKEQDTPISVLVKKKASDTEWKEMHDRSEAMMVQADSLIVELAKDMKLSSSDLHQ